jgi:futalosine hydrolase
MEGRILVMTAVEAERDAVQRGLKGDARFEVALAGVGPARAAARTAAILARGGFGLVISAGIGGGFAGRAVIGDLVVATSIVAADLGAETPDGFVPLDELGFGSARVQVDAASAERLRQALAGAGLSAVAGPVLTVSAATGTAATAAARAALVRGAAAEGMEGYGVAVAAEDYGVPVLEIRAVSNPVGPRDRSAWKIKEALAALEAASAILTEVLYTS